MIFSIILFGKLDTSKQPTSKQQKYKLNRTQNTMESKKRVVKLFFKIAMNLYDIKNSIKYD